MGFKPRTVDRRTRRRSRGQGIISSLRHRRRSLSSSSSSRISLAGGETEEPSRLLARGHEPLNRFIQIKYIKILSACAAAETEETYQSKRRVFLGVPSPCEPNAISGRQQRSSETHHRVYRRNGNANVLNRVVNILYASAARSTSRLRTDVGPVRSPTNRSLVAHQSSRTTFPPGTGKADRPDPNDRETEGTRVGMYDTVQHKRV